MLIVVKTIKKGYFSKTTKSSPENSRISIQKDKNGNFENLTDEKESNFSYKK